VLARQLGVSHVVVALNKADAADEEIAELVELEVRELLSSYGYPGEEVPVVRVSGLAALAGEQRWVASVLALLDAVDAYVPVPERYADEPFLMAVENALTISGRGTVVTGAIERGQVRVGDPVELVGLGAATRSVVTSVETFGKTMDSAQAGDNAALLLRGVGRHQVRRGQVLAAPGSLRAHQRFTATLHLLSAAEGGRRTPVRSGYSPQFYVRTTDVSGALSLDDAAGPTEALPGETVQVTVALGKPVALDAGQTFAVREGGRTVGAGTVAVLLDCARGGAGAGSPHPHPCLLRWTARARFGCPRDR
jgi:elongation factor Tu